MAEKVLMKGNEALAESAVRAGCRYFFGYPITMLIIKRSSWDSGSICVPADPIGFYVAITRKGDGTSWVIPSTVT